MNWFIYHRHPYSFEYVVYIDGSIFSTFCNTVVIQSHCISSAVAAEYGWSVLFYSKQEVNMYLYLHTWRYTHVYRTYRDICRKVSWHKLTLFWLLLINIIAKITINTVNASITFFIMIGHYKNYDHYCNHQYGCLSLLYNSL